MPEAWNEECGGEVFGRVGCGVEKGLRNESRKVLADPFAGKAALSCPQITLGSGRSPSLLLAWLTCHPMCRPIPPSPVPNPKGSREDGAWKSGRVQTGAVNFQAASQLDTGFPRPGGGLLGRSSRLPSPCLLLLSQEAQWARGLGPCHGIHV